MPDFGFDDWIDSQLRNVQLPPDFLSRLADSGPDGPRANNPRAGAPRDADPNIIAFNGQVSSRGAGDTSADGQLGSHHDQQLDTALRDVEVPAYLESRLRRIARRGRPMPQWQQFGLAASVVIVLGFGAALYVQSISRSGPLDTTRIARSPSAETTIAQGTGPQGPSSRSPRFVRPTPRSSGSRDVAVEAASGQRQPVDASLAGKSLGKLPFPTFKDMAAMSTSLKQAIDTRRRSLATLGARADFDPLPRLDEMEVPVPRGISPPKVRGYDMLFQLKHNEMPFVAPAAHPSLLSTKMPFTFQTASYDRAANDLRAERLPAGENIRVEDFLAAQNYALPAAAAGSLALHAALAPSPLEGSGVHLLQLAVQAPATKKAAHPPARLVAVIDTSSRMQGGARWETTLRALRKLAAHMGPADRLTLIGFAEHTSVLAEDASGDELRTLLAAGNLPQPTGLADFTAAIQTASEAVRSVKSSHPQRVVFITAGRGDFNESALTTSIESLRKMSEAATSWQIVRLAAAEDVDEQFDALVKQGHGTVSGAASADDIHGVLLEKMSGQPQTVAKGATLKLTFNPQVVTGYRLLGHASATLTGPTADPLEVDLTAHQAAVGLYELWVKPRGDDHIATAELAWYDPQTGQVRRAVQQLQRSRMAASFSQAPGWFQEGVIAAKTAEVLRGSSFAPASRPLGQILGLTEQVDPRIAALAEFQALVELIKQAEKLR